MQFVIVDPARATVERVEANELTDVYDQAGLRRNSVDHGTIAWSFISSHVLCIVVYEYSLFIPPDKARYFSICNRLFAGGAVLYAADEAGETVDLLVPPSVMFYRDAAEVERAIQAGNIIRPIKAYNGEVVWQWPEPMDVARDQAALRRALSDLGDGLALQVDDTIIMENKG